MNYTHDDAYGEGFRDGERNMAGEIEKLRAALRLIAELSDGYVRLRLSGETTMSAIDKAARQALK